MSEKGGGLKALNTQKDQNKGDIEGVRAPGDRGVGSVRAGPLQNGGKCCTFLAQTKRALRRVLRSVAI